MSKVNRYINKLYTLEGSTKKIDKKRRSIIIKLGKLKDPAAVKPILDVMYKHHLYDDCLTEALNALGNIADSSAVTPISKLLFSPVVHKEPRIAAAKALGEIGDTKAVNTLIRAIGINSYVRYYSIHALNQLGEQKWLSLLNGKGDIWDKLTQFDDERAIYAIISGLDYGEREERWNIINALVKLDDIRAVEPLIRHAHMWEKNIDAVLPLFHHSDAVEYLSKAIYVQESTQTNTTSSKVSGICLGKLKIIEPLIDALFSNNEYAACSAAQGLGYSDERAIEPLISSLGLYNESVYYAANSLKQLGEPKWYFLWHNKNISEFDKYYIESIKAICKMDDSRSVLALLTCLKNYEKTCIFILDDVVKRLGELKDSRAVEPLIDYLSYYMCDKVLTIEALRKIGDIRAIEPLENMIDSKDENIRRSLFAAFRQFDDPRAKSILAKLSNVDNK